MALSPLALAHPPCPGWRPLHLLQQAVQPLEVRFPDLPILLEPGTRLGERLALEPPGAPLRVLPDTDQPRALEELQVLGDCGLTDGERLCQLRDRRLPERQSGQDRAPS